MRHKRKEKKRRDHRWLQTIFPYSAAAAADTPAHFVAFCASRVRVRVHVPLDDLLHGRGNVKAGGVVSRFHIFSSHLTTLTTPPSTSPCIPLPLRQPPCYRFSRLRSSLTDWDSSSTEDSRRVCVLDRHVHWPTTVNYYYYTLPLPPLLLLLLLQDRTVNDSLKNYVSLRASLCSLILYSTSFHFFFFPPTSSFYKSSRFWRVINRQTDS